MDYRNFMKKNKDRLLPFILILSLVTNLYLVVQILHLEKKTEYVANNQYSNFFTSLYHYANSLEDLISNEEINSNEYKRNLRELSAYSFNILEYARAFSQLSGNDDKLANLIWDLAINIHGVNNKFYDLSKAIDNRPEIIEFSAVIKEIVVLENRANTDIKDGFVRDREEVYSIISPKIIQAMAIFE